MNYTPMKSRCCSLVLASLCSLVLVSLCRAQEISLFNGRDLTGWKGLANIWSVKDGAITGKLTTQNNPGMNTFIVWQGGEVSDFELTCKYRLKAENSEGRANSGIQFRANYTDEARFGMHGYQAEMDPGTQSLDQFPEGGGLNGCLMEAGGPGGPLAHVGQKVIIHFAPPQPKVAQGKIEVVSTLAPDAAFQKLYRPNDWNDYRIVAMGNHIQIFVNGQQTVDATDEINRTTAGLVGLQIHCSDNESKTVQFKDIKLLVLKGSGATQQLTAATTASLTLDPKQPLLETFTQMAPNASAWVLAALDEGVPPNVRQNLTYLREDLLDEYKQKPKASQEAYKLAHQLCSAMIAALDERDQTLVRAGFRAMQAEANTATSGNQALNARRNYMMSWPQYAREESQRAELRSAAANQSQVMKEQPKLEWSNRTAALRKTLDDLYAQFREALRQSPSAK